MLDGNKKKSVLKKWNSQWKKRAEISAKKTIQKIEMILISM